MDRAPSPPPQRVLEMLESLLRLPAGDLQATLNHVADLLAATTGADKVDAFLYDPARDSLVAIGTSTQALSALERKHGLDVLPLANGGCTAQVFKTGETFFTGRLEAESGELRGIKEVLGVRSTIGVALEVGGRRGGLLLLASQKPDFFSADDVRYIEAIASWVGLVAHRAELTEEIRRNALEHGRRAGAEELVTVLAHDLRNYLAPLDLRLEVLRARAERESRAEDLADIAAVGKSLDRFESLVSDILDVARLDQGLFRIAREKVDLAALVEESAGTFSTPHNRVHVNVQPGDPIVVLADESNVSQCVDNLIANAVQKSPRAAPVSVFVKRETRASGESWALVEVVDEGPGIAPELLPHVFERYVTGDRERGLGLGLYLAKRIAALHGGELNVESRPGAGARFTLSLPAVPKSAAAPSRAPADTPRG